MSDNIFFSKEFKENLHKYEEARENNSSVFLEPEQFTDIAEYYHLHGDLKRALEVIDDALNIFPGATEPLAFKARVSILVYHDVEKAMAFVDMIADKQDLEYFYIVAEIMIVDDRVEDAERYLESEEQTIDEEDLEDYYLDVASLFADYEVYDLAARWLALSSDTECGDYLELKGRIAMSKGSYKECEEIFNRLIDQEPYNNGYWNLLASAKYLTNDFSGSMECSDYSLAISPDDPDAILNRANCLMMLGNGKEAKSCYQRFKQLQPHSEVADMGIAAVLMNENNFEEALKYWKSAAKLCSSQSSNLFEIYRNTSLVYALCGEYNEAISTAEKLETLSGNSTLDVALLRGYVNLLAGDADSAKACFVKAIHMTSDKDIGNTLYYIAYCLFDCNYLRQAHDIFRRLADSDNNKDYADLWAYLVRTDYELGLQDEFLADLKKATERNPVGIQRELSDVIPNGMSVRDFYNYAIHHPLSKKGKSIDDK